MSKDKVTTSPTRFNGELDHFFDPNFTEEINQRMQVPKRIKVTGDCEDDMAMGIGGHPPPPAWETEKFDMHVPDRILVVDNPDPEFSFTTKQSMTSSLALSRVRSTDAVLSVNSAWRNTPPSFGVVTAHIDKPLPRSVSTKTITNRPKSRRQRVESSPDSVERYPYDRQDQLIGTRGTPIEVNHENAVLPPDPGLVRVQTPPRIITLTDHYFPSADDIPATPDEDPRPPARVIMAGNAHRISQSKIDTDGDRRNDIHPVRESTPSFTEGMTTNDEIAHLRRQLAKLNRRVMSIELENLQRQQYEKIAFVLGITYTIWKTLLWLRNS